MLHREIVKNLNITVAMVKGRLFRARKMLFHALAQEPECVA
jgi:DNA-directed RNA polymerase specialized sigma24 family protein